MFQFTPADQVGLRFQRALEVEQSLQAVPVVVGQPGRCGLGCTDTIELLAVLAAAEPLTANTSLRGAKVTIELLAECGAVLLELCLSLLNARLDLAQVLVGAFALAVAEVSTPLS